MCNPVLHLFYVLYALSPSPLTYWSLLLIRHMADSTDHNDGNARETDDILMTYNVAMQTPMEHVSLAFAPIRFCLKGSYLMVRFGRVPVAILGLGSRLVAPPPSLFSCKGLAWSRIPDSRFVQNAKANCKMKCNL